MKPEIKVVIGIIENAGNIVCVRQVEEKKSNEVINGKDKKDFLAGLWHLPGGKVSIDETLQDAMIREAMEEAGLKIVVNSLLAQRKEEREKAILHLHWFLCTTDAPMVRVGDDAVEGTFIQKHKVPSFCDPEVVAQWPADVKNYFIL